METAKNDANAGSNAGRFGAGVYLATYRMHLVKMTKCKVVGCTILTSHAKRGTC